MRFSSLAKFIVIAATFSAASFSSQSAMASSATRSNAKLLNAKEIAALSSTDRLRYFKALQKITIALEEAGGPEVYDSFSYFNLLISTSYAAVTKGGVCWIGGYESQWYRKKGGGYSCAAPSEDKIRDDYFEAEDGTIKRKGFFCGDKKSPKKKAYCNSAIFLFGNDDLERSCQPIKNLSANCEKAFNERYANNPDRLKADLSIIIDAVEPEDKSVSREDAINSYYKDLENKLNSYLADTQQDASTANVLLAQIKTLNEMQASIAKEKQEPKSKLLGEELSCVKDGLTQAGYQPSERFIALLGVGAQSANGAFDTNQPAARDNLRSRVISMIQSYGVCDEGSYPTADMKPNDVANVRRWLTSDGGAFKAQSGLSYFQQSTDTKTKTAAARDFFNAFGMRSAWTETADGQNPALDAQLERAVDSALNDMIVKPMQKWESTGLVDRQSAMASWDNIGSTTPFAGCFNAAKDMREADPAFSLQMMKTAPKGADGKAPIISSEQRTSIMKTMMASTKVCESMANACGLDAGTQCSQQGKAMEHPTVIKGAKPKRAVK